MEEELELQCPLCLDTFEHAASTQCGHTFCGKCITEVLRRDRKCPVCRQQVTGVSANYTVRNIVQAWRARERRTTPTRPEDGADTIDGASSSSSSEPSSTGETETPGTRDGPSASERVYPNANMSDAAADATTNNARQSAGLEDGAEFVDAELNRVFSTGPESQNNLGIKPIMFVFFMLFLLSGDSETSMGSYVDETVSRWSWVTQAFIGGALGIALYGIWSLHDRGILQSGFRFNFDLTIG